MSSIGFRSNVLFAIAAATGVIAALGRPWYGPAPASSQHLAPGEIPAQMEDFFSGLARAFTEPDGTLGWDAFGSADHLIAGFAGATVLLVVLALIPALQCHVDVLARWTALTTLAICAVKLFDEPGANHTVEPRYGAILAVACAAVLLATTCTVAAAPVRRPPRPVLGYTPPPPPPAPQAESTWGPPQY